MKLEITESLPSDDWQHLTGWHDNVFPVEGKGIQWSTPSHHIVARDSQGRPAGHIGYGKFIVESTLQPFAVIGVGGVVVRPEYQGQGIPAQMFSLLHQNKPGQDCLQLYTLFCPARLEAYYQKHGYKKYSGRLKILQNNQLVKTDFTFMFRGNTLFGSKINLTSNPW